MHLFARTSAEISKSPFSQCVAMSVRSRDSACNLLIPHLHMRSFQCTANAQRSGARETVPLIFQFSARETKMDAAQMDDSSWILWDYCRFLRQFATYFLIYCALHVFLFPRFIARWIMIAQFMEILCFRRRICSWWLVTFWLSWLCACMSAWKYRRQIGSTIRLGLNVISGNSCC